MSQKLERADGLVIYPPTHDQIANKLGGKFPTYIDKINFDNDGFILDQNGTLLLPIYLAAVDGFTVQGREFIENLKLRLAAAGGFVLDPWEACSEYKMTSPESRRIVIDTICYDVLMPRSKAMVALLDGADVDSGVTAEIVTMANLYGPVIGIRTDTRLCEGPGQPINIMLQRYVSKSYGGGFYTGNQAFEKAINHIKGLRTELISQR